MIYTFDSRVRYSEVDHQGTLTLPALMNYLQDCSTFQSEDIGVGLSVLRERNGRGFSPTGRWKSDDTRSWEKGSRWGRWLPDLKAFSETGIFT